MAIFKQSYVHGNQLVKCYSASPCKKRIVCRDLCIDPIHVTTVRCKLVIVGGGAGGCSVAWRLARRLRPADILLLEPSKVHYYQPSFTLVASGIKSMSKSKRPIERVLPRNIIWLQDHAEEFDPCNNVVHTRCGYEVQYDYMVVSVGLKNDYDKLPGLKKELDDPNSQVCTIYSADYCEKAWRCLQRYRGGHAVFTFPRQAGKCPGAAQKIMYLADDYWRKRKMRHLTSITYNTAAKSIFGVPKYAAALEDIASSRNIVVNCNVELVEIAGPYAVFTGEHGQCVGFPYNFLHVTPPMSPPACLARCPALVTESGYLDVDRSTLQHRTFSNIYGIGDCTSTPNSKTAAAIGPQSYVVQRNLTSTMSGKAPTHAYTGYGACPILTSYRTGILAEFEYGKKIKETFPFDQSKERWVFYKIHTHCMSYIYWNGLLKGKWSGPSTIRKIINPFNK